MSASAALQSFAVLTGWNEESKVLLLSRFIDSLSDRAEGTVKPCQIVDDLEEFLREQALEEGLTEDDLNGVA
jgi:hypothetical protein